MYRVLTEYQTESHFPSAQYKFMYVHCLDIESTVSDFTQFSIEIVDFWPFTKLIMCLPLLP